MIATALVNKIHLESETPNDVATILNITRGKLCVLGEGIGTDSRGVRVATLTVGRWGGKSEEEKAELLKIDNQRLASLEHLLAAIPPCPGHGEGCIAYAMEWIAKAKAEKVT